MITAAVRVISLCDLGVGCMREVAYGPFFFSFFFFYIRLQVRPSVHGNEFSIRLSGPVRLFYHCLFFFSNLKKILKIAEVFYSRAGLVYGYIDHCSSVA